MCLTITLIFTCIILNTQTKRDDGHHGALHVTSLMSNITRLA